MIRDEPVVLEDENVELPPAETEVSLLEITALLVKRKRFLARFVLGGALLATILAFVLPVEYEAKVVLLPPTQNSSIASTLLAQLGNASSLGSLNSLTNSLGMKTPAEMYVSFLTSRTVEDGMIQRFSLMDEYHAKRMSDARKAFERHTTAVAGTKDGLIRITVEDRNPKRAAELANGYLEEFRRLSASLAITEAARRRLFFEREMEQAKNDLTAAEDAMQKTQQTTGVLQIDSQARSLIESAALLRGQVVAKQVQVQSMRSYAAEDNPSLILAKQQLAALQSQLDHLADSSTDAGSGIVLSKGRVTEAGLEYVRRYRDLKYRETVFELLAKELEIAKIDEAREGEMVQVVDAAVPPDRRSSPHRLLIILGGTVLAFVLALFWIRLREGWNRLMHFPHNRQRMEEIRSQWKSKAA